MPFSNARQWRLFAVVLLLVAGALGLGYYWFIARDYAPLVQSVRPEEAAAIVQELKKESIPFELRDGGTTVLVPVSQVDAARLDISGDDLSFKGTVGFELFNQSDMGLTEFAQKVNYQRALQGEIARTIMAMDGISFARVHIALPEHSLFRTAASEPRAAVTLIPRPGVDLDPQRIAGIQRLVAAAVPDLALDQVAILNERGDLLTPAYSEAPHAADGNALVDDYRERAMSAAAEAAPRAHFDITVSLVPRNGAARRPADATPDRSDEYSSARDHDIHVVLFERTPLLPAEEQEVRRAVVATLALDPAHGDVISFSPPTVMAPPPPSPVSAGTTRWGAAESTAEKDRLMAAIGRGWTIALFVLLAAGLAAVGGVWRRRTATRREVLVRRIHEHLLIEGAADVA